MKKLSTILFLLITTFSFATKHYLNNTTSVNRNYTFGDTVLFRSTVNYDWNYFGNCHGTDSAHPVVLINDGGQAQLHGNIDIDDCSFIKITGTGSADYYGFKWDNAFVGIKCRGKINGIYIDHCKFINEKDGGSAITFKTDLVFVENDYACDTVGRLYPSRMSNLDVGFCYFDQCHDEAIYVGTTYLSGTLHCYGNLQRRPMGIANVRIHDNIAKNIGRQFLNLGHCDSGYAEVYNNDLFQIGDEFSSAQGTGIYVGTYTHNVHVYNNTIKRCWQHGIKVTGTGTVYIYGNNIDSTGIIYGTRDYSIWGGKDTTYTGFHKIGVYNGNSFNVWTYSNYAVSSVTNPDTSSLTVKIYANSNDGWSTAPHNLEVKDPVKIITDTGNVICDMGILLIDQGIKYSDSCSGTNTAPTVFAGNDTTITTSSIVLHGTATDDGTVASTVWTQISGAASTITNGTTLNPTMSGLVTGAYVYRLTATDNLGLSAFDDIEIVVNLSSFTPPIVFAGNDTTITAPQSFVFLTGVATGTGGATISALKWNDISSPGNPSFSNKNTDTTTVSGLAVGDTYLWFRGTDNHGLKVRDTIKITMLAADTNYSPVAIAGNDVVVYYPGTQAILYGDASYDIDGTIEEYSWTQLTNLPVTISNANSPTPLLTGMIPGVYVFELKVTDDDGATATDIVTVSVRKECVCNCD